jgi:hypothetical protein
LSPPLHRLAQPLSAITSSFPSPAYSLSQLYPPPITTVDLKAVKAREAATIKKMRERDATRGKGVTKEAQELFDALARTYVTLLPLPPPTISTSRNTSTSPSPAEDPELTYLPIDYQQDGTKPKLSSMMLS